MKRALIAVVAVGFVVAAISIARANSGEHGTPEVKPSAGTLDRDVVTEQVKQQSDQVLKAQAELREQTEELADEVRSRPLVITLREERPGEVWVFGRTDGTPACVTPPKKVPTYISVTGNDGQLATELVPLEAKRLTSGACEATIKLYLLRQDWYEISITGAGHGKFGPVKLDFSGEPQKVTVAG